MSVVATLESGASDALKAAAAAFVQNPSTPGTSALMAAAGVAEQMAGHLLGFTDAELAIAIMVIQNLLHPRLNAKQISTPAAS